MHKEFFLKITKSLFASFLVVSTVYFILKYNSVHMNPLMLYYYYFYLYFLTVCFIVLHKYKLKIIFLGLFLLLISLIFDLLLIHKIFNENEIIDFIFHKIFNIFGIIFLVYGLWNAVVKNKILLSKLKDIAYYDPISNLPNRNYLLKQCPVKMEVICDKRVCGECVLSNLNLLDDKPKSFLFIDIDDFKFINDNLGHANGDILLRNIAERLKSCITSDDTLIHLSGDEFLVILNYTENIEATAQKMIDLINESYNVSGVDVHITCSIGIAYFPIHGNSLDELIRKADIAMYEAKKEGKNNYYIFSNKIEKGFNKRFELISDIINAIKNEDFVVYYQTKANVITGQITGLEALARWIHPKKGIIYPIDFIPLAEDTGLIKDIDSLILKQVCQLINNWISEGKEPYNISVNISPLFFMDKYFLSTLDEIINGYQIDAKYLSIEVTENIALRDSHQTKRILNELKNRNIKVHLDDFGRGYSSFRYINEFTVDYIKIDKAFIDKISDDQVSQTLVNAIVSLSSKLNFKVIPEGVETIEQLETLKKLGCHEFQGYYLNKPQPIERIELEFNDKLLEEV